MEMIGGLKRTTSHFAIAALASVLVGGVFASPSKAADLGGDCCADLEERVAELEATTVRKGNRNVSVTLYGWVNAGITWFDNGEESDAYVVDTDTASSRIGVKGSGKIKPGWEAGYRLEIKAAGDDLSGTAENDLDDGTGAYSSTDSNSSLDGVRLRQANWYIKSDQLGKVTVGQQDSAANGIESIDLSGAASWISYNGAQDWNFSYAIIGAGGASTGLIWANVLDDFDRGRGSYIRYDTPAIAGFTASVSWGEDDRWAGALRYSQDWNGLAVEAGIGYENNTDELGPGGEVETYLASLSLYHSATGLFGVVSYGEQDVNVVGIDNATNWYGKIGWRKNISGMGETAIYGEYTKSEDVTPGTSADQWGAGVGQDIDAVGGTLYLGYRHSEADLGPGITTQANDQVLGGMVLPF
ncbi:MAG: porin [Hyphomicrobiaceae bacterium]